MFLDEITPEELGFSEEEWDSMSVFDRRVCVAFFVRRTPIATSRALGLKDSSFSTVRRKIVDLELVKRFTQLRIDQQEVPAPQESCAHKQ
jgi:hypothetical protein|tara:strand:+ start:9805 stop:10074 length:270 start_codon:yes stop_codon:yes gene_type:complete